MKLLPNTLDLSIILPSLHEAGNLRLLLPKLVEVLGRMGITWEILVVDGDSQDGTREIVEETEARYILESTPGYGNAIKRGIREAQGEYILTLDADLSHPSEFIHSLWDARKQAEITIASRYVEGGGAEQPWFRLQLSRILNAFFRFGLSLPLGDMTSGYRLYKKSLFRCIDLDYSNFVILMEILIKTYQKGMQIQEKPFYYRPRREGLSHAKIIQFGLDYLRLFGSMWKLRNSINFPDYDWRAYNSRIWPQRYWQRKRHDIILRFVPQSVSTCDVGCGSSHILARMPHAVGVDLRHEKLAFMRKTNRHLVQGDGMGLPFADESFACLISSQIIEHIPDEQGRHIDECLRVLKPGGTLIIGTPDYGGWQWPLIEWFYARIAPGAYADEHVNPYTFKELREALEERGCSVVEVGMICKAELILKAVKQ